MRTALGTVLAAMAFAGALGACGDDDRDTSAAAEAAAEEADESAATATGWEEVVPGGDCQCSDGSEFSFQVREASPQKVVLFFQGGGGCWSAETCALGNETYRTSAGPAPGQEGMFDFADERNPFADHSVVHVPYCTGDAHIGDATTEYTPDLTVQHKGLANGTAALDHLVAAFPDAADVVVMGESAGSIAAPFYAGLVSDRLPDARITVLADGSGAFPDGPEVSGPTSAAWGGAADDDWSPPALFVRSWQHDPEIVFARYDFAYDHVQTMFNELLGIDSEDPASMIDANEARIEDAGVNLLSYTAPGDDHTVMGDAAFYDQEVGGQALVDWVARLVAGEPVDDVRCDECAG
jgi:hypothetical protein